MYEVYEVNDSWQLPRELWWQVVLDTDWASEASIVEACGPEYLMYADMLEFGNEAAKQRWP